MLGYTGEEMINTRFLNYIHPHDRDRAKEIYTRRFAGESVPARHELALADKQGKMVEVGINAGIITFHGQPADFVFIHDISHLKLVERRIRESEELYRNIVELAPDGIATILRRAGYSVITAIGGKDALSKTASQEEAGFDLLITDVIMPEMSGKELSEKISALYPATKTLYISGYPDDKIARHGVLEEGVTFLQKPFSPAALTEKVQEVLKGR